MSYASIQAIRESAGLLSRSENETLTGIVDGTNKSFVVARRPIVDSNYDDLVDISDVQMFVDGIPVEVTNVVARSGSITLKNTPTIGQRITGDYRFSPISEEYTGGKQDEADSWVNSKLRLADVTPTLRLPLHPVPGVISTVAELYAAGLILTRDWGNRVDTEQTSKDGYAKIKLARELLADYISGLEFESRSASNGNASVMTNRDVFSREMEESCDGDDEDFFMRRKC